MYVCTYVCGVCVCVCVCVECLITYHVSVHILYIYHDIHHGPSYKTFYICKLQLFIISQSVCPWQAFPAQSNVSGQVQEPTLERSTCKVLHFLGSCLTCKHQTRLEKLARKKHSSLFLRVVTYGSKKYNKTSFLVQIKFITEDSTQLFYKY